MSGANKEKKKQYLSEKIKHLDISKHDTRTLVEAMSGMAYSSRDLARAAKIYDKMIADKDCWIILTLAGSLVSAGLKKVFADMIKFNMVDAVVSTGANIVDQDFFEALGYSHYIAPDVFKTGIKDPELRELGIDRIYDTFIDEDELRVCDDTTKEIADSLAPRPYASWEFIRAMGSFLDNKTKPKDSIIYEAFKNKVPIFCPAFSDCSAGFGLVSHQHERGSKEKVSIDSAKDFYDLTKLKLANNESGILMLGGGVPKNFTQDIVVAADIIGKREVPMHKYAVQVTVADVRDGALSSSTLSEAHSWGKVDTTNEQMVYSEATLAVPLIVGYAYASGNWKQRSSKHLIDVLS